MKIWNLGYPRVGKKRDLKKALEQYWAGKSTQEECLNRAKKICQNRWKRQLELGVESIPVNDFSFYDHMLDQAYLLGVVSKRFQSEDKNWLDKYFGMARGYKNPEVSPLDMTKWFNTNYHYLVSELKQESLVSPCSKKLELELAWASELSFPFHLVFVGPWTFYKLSQCEEPLLLKEIVERYTALLKKWNSVWVQIDEPAFCLDMTEEEMTVVKEIYDSLGKAHSKIMLATYFESPAHLSSLCQLNVAGLHLDCVHGKDNLAYLSSQSFPKDKYLSLGLVNGRNIWVSDLSSAVDLVKKINFPSDKLFLSPSCSLLHLPHDKNAETKWDKEFLSWVSFADQRIEELKVIKNALNGSSTELGENKSIFENKLKSQRIHKPEIKEAVKKIDKKMMTRNQSFEKRIVLQSKVLSLPLLPTTTIGSFPQTESIRHARQEHKKGTLTDVQYKSFLENEIKGVVKLQEELGLDILVHGEPERNDMVEYFGELLEGFAFSDHGWVQSYGSRCVKPPIIYGDVKRQAPMTVDWFKFSQSCTVKPMKAMLTGPVTILHWSFVREDQSKSETSKQIALAIREEVLDLEKAGAKVIQVDEAAIREGLPIKKKDRSEYLKWAVDSFKICSASVKDETQIHTHMCYSEFSEMMEAICAMDADVLLIEYARSGSKFLSQQSEYPNHIGPGVYDIHSPRIPNQKEVENSILDLLSVFSADKIWINPDCGLKTRRYEEVKPALANMVLATLNLRSKLSKNYQSSPRVEV